jgi:uncharacterized membrane protein
MTQNAPMPPRPRQLLRTFVTGLLAALPLVGTLAIFAWLLSVLWAWLGPSSGLGRVFVAIGFDVTGSIVLGYVFGIAFIAAGLFALGLLVEAGLERGLRAVVEGIVQRIPFVRSVYDLIRRIVSLMSKRDANGMSSMSPVWCHFGGPGGAAVIGLLSTPEPVLVGGRACLCVMVPTAPVPIGGVLIYVPVEWVEPADIGVEGVTSLYVSMGVTSAQVLPRAAQPGSPPAAPQASAASSDA